MSQGNRAIQRVLPTLNDFDTFTADIFPLHVVWNYMYKQHACYLEFQMILDVVRRKWIAY